MMRSEFEELINDDISVERYEKVELLYVYHPYFKSKGKKDIADFYVNVGYEVMVEMIPVAKKFREMEEEQYQIRSEMERLKEKYDNAVSKYGWAECNYREGTLEL